MTPGQQKWLRCDFEWGLEEYVTTQAFGDYRLILCELEQYSRVLDGVPIGGLRYVPVKAKDLERWEP